MTYNVFSGTLKTTQSIKARNLVRRTRTVLGARDFAVSSAVVWNSLPTELRLSSQTVATFTRHWTSASEDIFFCAAHNYALITTARSELRKVLFLAPSVCGVFVCVWNISGTAERICAKFTRKTCLVTHSEEFEGRGQRSRSPGTKHGYIFGPFRGLRAVCLVKSVTEHL